MAELRLIGYRFSVYTRVVRMALIEKGLSADYVEVDPFRHPVDAILTSHTPFGRVPVLSQGDFHLYETAAILRFLDALSDATPLTPQDPREVARMQQVIGIVDSYGYGSLVRSVFSEAVFGPAFGTPGDCEKIAEGLRQAEPVLDALEAIAAEGLALGTGPLTLGDIHLAPMLSYFDMAPEGRQRLEARSCLSDRFRWVSRRQSFTETDPRPFTG
ncbi:glutathione S-transferase family protein [Sulfitobacter sp. LCG007]